jgi:hypothetical protein
MEEMMNTNQAKTNANLKKVRKEIVYGHAVIRSIVHASIADMKDRKEIVSCQVTTAACLDNKELDPEEMESEHREVPMLVAIMKLVKGRKKQCRGQKLAVG